MIVYNIYIVSVCFYDMFFEVMNLIMVIVYIVILYINELFYNLGNKI